MKKRKYIILVDYDGVTEITMKMCECEHSDKAILCKEAFELLYKDNPCYSVRIKTVEYYIKGY